MHIHTFVLGDYQVNTYIVTADGGTECLVIDPGYEPDTVLDYANQHSLTISAILLTHGHFDHVGAVKTLASETGCRVFLCQEDLALPPMWTAGQLYYTDLYAEGYALMLAGLSFTVLHTPGHTPGSVCLKFGDTIFSGDTLFQFSCGRTDFPGGDRYKMTDSLRRLAAIPENCTVFPGHGGKTTLDAERRVNPYMQ